MNQTERIKTYIKEHSGSVALMAVWVLMFAADKAFDLTPRLTGMGLSLIGNEWWRLIAAPHLHYNLIHLIANLSGLFWAGWYAERYIGSGRLFWFMLVAGALSSLLYAALFPQTDEFMGGSIAMFALLGLIAALLIFRSDFPRLKLGTWYGNWLVGYATIGNIPFLPFMSWHTPLVHGVSLLTGFALGALCLWIGRRRESQE